ncbi:uncharacterized protein LOC126410405 [Nymphaea colorata]|nr:uncharacterized protein LOC126410405 [Nymphaea colorata]
MQAMATTLRHGAHVHPLQLMGKSETNGLASSCGGCGLPFRPGSVLYGCRSCCFFLHRGCALLLPSLEGHAAHRHHSLYLVYAPPASSRGALACNICGNAVSQFNYNCHSCNFHAHPFCLQMPQVVRCPAHHHPLHLSYSPPSERSTYCDVCRLQIHYCCYSCSCKTCVFDLHPDCTTKQLAYPGRKKGYKREKVKKVFELTAGIVTKTLFGQVVLGTIGLDGAMDILDYTDVDNDDEDGGDVPDIGGDFPDGNDDFSVNMDTFYDLPASDGTVDDALQEETSCLLLSHVEGMDAGTGTSST